MTITNMNYWVIIGIGERESILGPFESEEVQQQKFEEAEKEIGEAGVIFKHRSLETDPEKAFQEFRDAGEWEKKPPVRIGKQDKPGSLHAEEAIIQPAPVPAGKTGGMPSWMPSIVACVIAIAVSAGMLYMFNPASAELNTLASQIEENLNNKIASIESTVSQSNQRLESLLSSSANYATQDALSGLASEQSLADLSAQFDTQMAEVNARLDALEAEAEEEAIAQTVLEDTVRWRFTDASFDFTVAENHDLVEIDVSSKTIDEEDYYNVKVTLEYLGKDDDEHPLDDDEILDIGNCLSLVLTPRGDALLDESYTNLYSESSPYTDWDADFRTRERDGVKTTSRVVFESYDPYDLTLTEGEVFRIDLELELAYAR